MDVNDRIASNRRRLAAFFGALDEEQLDARSLCAAWTVREVLGHLVMPLVGGIGTLLVASARHGGSLDKGSVTIARNLARRPVAELTAVLREQAGRRVRAPGVGPMGQMADGCIHLRDCARPLGLDDDVSLEDWRIVLDWLAGGVHGLVPRRRVRGLALEATDQDWTAGTGARLSGPSEALALAMAGRTATLAELQGDGVDVLRARLGTTRPT
jgi:uncharacterized protein (TIGR03083 family)